MTNTIFSIGHSTHTIGKLIELLQRHEITAIADVRSQPYSRMNPQFNRESLHAALQEATIAYAFLGRELGARPVDRSCYVAGKVQYDRLAQTSLFQAGLGRISQGATRFRIALLCAEKDPLTCHRTILVCRHLIHRGLQATHIRENGRLEPHEEALTRLLRELGLGDVDLFRNRQELINEAYAQRGNDIAYVEKPRSPSNVAAERYVR